MSTLLRDAATLLRNLGACIMAFGLCALGVVCTVAPHEAASLYGLPVTNSGNVSWVLVAGLRDIGLGLATLALQLFEPRALRYYVPAILCVPIGDAVLTISQGGTALDAATHGLGTIAVAILAACAWLDQTLDVSKGHNAKAS